MTSPTKQSFLDELIKIAFGPEEAAKVSRLAKKIQLPKASYQSSSTIAARPPASKFSPEDRAKYKMRGGPLIYPGLGKLHSQFHQPLVVSNYLRDIPSRRELVREPRMEQSRMLHAILKGHELDETKVNMKDPGRHDFHSHLSPEVMLKEHNRVTTLPKEYDETRHYMQALRGFNTGKVDDEGLGYHNTEYSPGKRFTPEDISSGIVAKGSEVDDLRRFGIMYGAGPRLSRHARKRITEYINKRSRESLDSGKVTSLTRREVEDNRQKELRRIKREQDKKMREQSKGSGEPGPVPQQ